MARLRPAKSGRQAPPGLHPGRAPSSPATTYPSRFTLSTNPGLVPSYRGDVPDYTTACEPGSQVAVKVTVPRGQTVTVDGHASGPGSVSRTIALTPGQAFRFTVRDAAGAHTHNVRCTPSDFPTWSVRRDGTPQADWLVFAPSLGVDGAPYSVIADAHGVPVWWMRDPADAPIDTKVLPDGTVVWARKPASSVAFSESTYAHRSLAGADLGDLAPAGGSLDHHDLQQLPNGNYLAESYVPRAHVDLSPGGPADATVLDAVLREITASGEVVWSWNSKDHIAPGETDAWGVGNTATPYAGGTAYDLVHVNSVEQTGDTIVMSGRHLDAVYGISRLDGSIKWKLGGTTRPESLIIEGDPLSSSRFGGQHDARLLPDGTLTIHDNGTRRDRPPQALRYAIDPSAATATLLEDVADDRISDSACCGSARRLAGGDWLMSWGGQPLITELDAGGSPVLTLHLNQGYSYRAQPVSASVLSREQLRAGMDAQVPR